MQQIYRRTLMQKCDFNKIAIQLYWNHTSAWVTSCRFVADLQNTFSEDHIWRAATVYLYLIFLIRHLKKTSLNLVLSANFHLTFTGKDPQPEFILCKNFYYYLYIKKISLLNIFQCPTIFLFPEIFNKTCLKVEIHGHFNMIILKWSY